MSKAVKKVARVALPVVGSFFGPIGGAIGGAVGEVIGGGGVKGIATGAALGGAGGFLASGGLTSVLGGTSSLGSGATTQGLLAAGPGAATGFSGATRAGASGILSNLGSAKNLLSLGNIGSSLFSAKSGADAADKAAKQQADAANRAISAQQQALAQVRGDLAPFKEAGESAVRGLTELVNDPNAQTDFIQNNPFYQSLAEDAKDKLFANKAARGKVGSGGTTKALQNSLLLLGSDLLNQNITQKQNLANLGSNAAAQTGTFTQGAANTTSRLLTDQGNSQAAGTIGAHNAQTGAINNALGTQAALFGIDKGVRI